MCGILCGRVPLRSCCNERDNPNMDTFIYSSLVTMKELMVVFSEEGRSYIRNILNSSKLLCIWVCSSAWMNTCHPWLIWAGRGFSTWFDTKLQFFEKQNDFWRYGSWRHSMRKATHKVRTTDDILGCNTTRIKQIKTNKGETQKQRKPLSLVFQIIHTRWDTSWELQAHLRNVSVHEPRVSCNLQTSVSK